ncbi:Replicative DNA helicase [Thermoanaerobacter sp. YS13]|uniref:replicative DNA helicase n=1 Tax=Thermoanaerobacter sp. YS13 TaxID=1511746 RepID=UPI000574B08A|nr:DnaB-like helicase C-terminal domain-containing protein [Thermoanaerobacter sp. YS13]KHO63381.1 Replicative DNA helicase [Thermoanaerobacter sp. YS13]
MYNNPNVEREVLISIILYPEDYTHYIRFLAEEDFTLSLHKKILRAIKEIIDEGKSVDILLIADKVPEIEEFINNAPPPNLANIDEYINELKQKKIQRDLNKLSDNIKASLSKGVKNEKIIAAINQYLKSFDLTTDAEFLKNVLLRTLSEIEEIQKNKEKRIKLDIRQLDDMVMPGDMTVIGARPGTGKTAFALKIAVDLAKQGKKIYFVSREMTNEQITKRLLAKFSRVDNKKIKIGDLTQDDWDALVNAAITLSKLNILLDCKTAYIEDLYLKLAATKDIDCLIIDYLQLMQTRERAENRNLEIGKMTRILKMMNIDLKIPIFVLSQLNREGEREPTLKNLRESGNIEQDFNNVIFLHTQEEELEKDIRKIKLIIAKHRDGNVGKYDILFEPRYMEFYEIDKR